MEILKISYSSKGAVKNFSLLLSVYSLVFGAGLMIAEVLAKNYQLIFYASAVLALIGLILSLILILNRPKPLILVTLEELSTKFPGKPSFVCEWVNVKDLAIGVSSLRITMLDDKIHDLDLSEIKYKDLRIFKGKVIELCENRNIPYKNDY